MLRTGESLGKYRTLQSQEPFLVNTGLNYSNPGKVSKLVYFIIFK